MCRRTRRAGVPVSAATLRTELDLADLSPRLVDVVEATMQPTHVSLWLRPLPGAPYDCGAYPIASAMRYTLENTDRDHGVV